MIKDKKIISVNFKNKTNRYKTGKSLDQKAIRDYKVSINYLLHKFGTYLLKTGKYNLSNKMFNLAKAYKPKLTNYLIGLSYYYSAKQNEKEGNYTKSKELYKKAICYYNICLKYCSNNPGDFHILLEMANIYLELDDIYAFSKIYQKMILHKSSKINNKVCKLKKYNNDIDL